MILVDSSVWVDHLRSGNATLSHMLDAGRVLAHPFVIGELALGSLKQRDIILAALQDLPRLCRCAPACLRASDLGWIAVDAR